MKAYRCTAQMPKSRKKQLSLERIAIDEARPEQEYSPKDHDAFGWVRLIGLLGKGQYADFSKKFAQAKSGIVGFEQTNSGEFMIPGSNLSFNNT